MTLTEKQKLQKRARLAICANLKPGTKEWVWFMKDGYVYRDPVSVGGHSFDEDKIIRKELRRAVRLVKGRGK